MARKEVACEDGDVLRIRFDFDQRLIDLVKGLPGRRWDGAERCWTVPVEHVVTVVELLQGEGFSFDETTQRLYEEYRNHAPQDLTVSQLNMRVRNVLYEAFPTPIWVVGEITGYNKSAHKKVVDFQLVERGEAGKIVATVDAVLFPDTRQAIEAKLEREGKPFRLEDEVTVRVLTQVDLRVEWGAYRVIVKDLDVSYTLGEVARRREEILRKLTREGLVHRNRSLSFPLVPLRVGLITSLGSDAEKDVLKTLRESGYAFQVVVHGARVQGPYTEASVLNALDWFRAHAGDFDVVLICRGGGSRTDLAWFDSEALGRAVATFPLPVVVGIGHEEDRCVLDEVGWRAKTPTAAAQILVKQVKDTLDHVREASSQILSLSAALISEAKAAHVRRTEGLIQAADNLLGHEGRELSHRALRLSRGVKARLDNAGYRLKAVSLSLPRAVGTLIGGRRTYLEDAEARLIRSARRELNEAERRLKKVAVTIGPRGSALVAREIERLEARTGRLRALDPRRVVERGYAILRLACGGVVTDPAQAPPGTQLLAELKRGVLKVLSEGAEGGEKDE